ncbi:class I SAM-dependent methyltransferase [bacterium]|nr:class I SAM-dependent methyltransferase [bacterium]
MSEKKKNARDVFNAWALDYHTKGMEKGHWESVREAFSLIPESGGNYLEIGVGNGYGIAHMARNHYRGGMCYGLDISENMVRVTAERTRDLANVRLEAADFLTWEPPAGVRFSCIFSMEVFYYFADVAAGITRAASLLAPGGMLAVLVNHHTGNPESYTWSDDLGTPMVLWSAREYEDAFRAAGLSDIGHCYLPDRTDQTGTLCTMGVNHRR